MRMHNSKPDWIAWVIFGGTFIFCHFAFFAFLVLNTVLRSERSDNREGLFLSFFLIFSGVITGLESLAGYVAVDTIISIGRSWSRTVGRVASACGGTVAYALVWITILGLRLQLPKLSENVGGSFFSGNLMGGIPWGAMFLGGLVACVVKIVAMMLTPSRHRRAMTEHG
jgi:hypothetical protein